MSALGSLFGGGSGTDSNDSLKYSAPKEPKKKQKASAANTASDVKLAEPANPASTSSPPSATSVAPKAIGPPKMVASASVRLYKLNPTTRGYDAVEGGGLLGSVIMGAGLNFQLLIYNAQKQPQVYITLSNTFDYTVAGLYLSFSDPANNYFSVLFDNPDLIFNFVKVLAAVIIHLQSYNGDTGDLPNIKRALPAALDQTAEDVTALSTGMVAGIYYSIWEIGELGDYPNDIVSVAPSVQNKEPDELLKVKISDVEEFLPGLSSALTGYKRGDRFILAIPPQTLTTKPVTKSLFEAAKKKNPFAYLYIIIEVSKIKSSAIEKQEKKRDSISEDKEEGAALQANTVANSSSVDLSVRMAKMAASSGGNNAIALAGIMNPKAKVPVESTNETKRTVSFKDNYEESTPIPIVPIPVKNADPVVPPVTVAASKPVEPIVAQPIAQPQVVAHAQQQEQSQPQQHQQQQQQNQQQHQQYQSYNAPVIQPQSPYSVSPSTNNISGFSAEANNAFSQQLNSSIMIVQQSLMQLHTKLDQVGMQVTNVYSLQQQNQNSQQQISMTLQTLSASAGGVGNGGQVQSNANPSAWGMNHMGMPGMMNPMMTGGYNPMMFPQAAYNPYNMYSAPPQGNGLLNSSNPQLKYKSDEITNNLSFILQQYELLKQENQDLKNKAVNVVTTDPTVTQQQQDKIKQLEQKVIQLEEEKRNIQTEKDKISLEKLQFKDEAEQLKQQLNLKNQELNNLESSPQFQTLLQQRLQSSSLTVNAQLQQLQNEKVSLQAEFEEEKKKVQELLQEISNLKASSGSTPPKGGNERDQKEIADLQSQIVALREEVTQKTQQLQQQSNDGAGKFTVDDIKGMISEIYKLAMGTFVTEEELNSLEDEAVRNHTIQLVKTVLKRLKDVLRQVTADKLN